MREYAQGAAQSAVNPVADFLAPTVPVATSVGKFKIYTAKNRFALPDTRRAVGGRATEIGWSAADGTYNCAPNALDVPVDVLEEMESEPLESMLREAAVMAAEIGGLAHEKNVIDTAVAGLTPVPTSFGANADPINILDGVILDVIKAAKYGSLMGVRVLFGSGAFKGLKNHPLVRGRFVVGGGAAKSALPLASVNEEEISNLLIGQPKTRTSFMVYDAAKEGVAEDIRFILDNSIIVYACKDAPTRRDPSFMKTFRLMNQWMVPGTYMRDDGRVEVAKFDWSEDVKVTNSAAARLLAVTF
jgi:hypothetical protein